jgi:hypothetical protein
MAAHIGLEDVQRLLLNPTELQQALATNPEGFTGYFQSLLDQGLNHQASNSYTDPPTERSNVKSEKHPDPPMFTGIPSKWREFKTQLRVKLLVNRDRFATSQSRLAYTISRLQGNPLTIVTPRIIHGIIGFPDYEELLSALDITYEDPNIRVKAQRELRNLKQRNRELYLYLADFQRLIEDTGITDNEARKSAFMGGLSIELLNLLVHHDIPEGFNDLVKLLQSLDSRYRQTIGLTKEHHTQRTSPRFTSNWTPTPVTMPLGDPMDLGASTKKVLTKDEKERRIREGLCHYCGEKGHYTNECPKNHNRRRTNYSPTQRPQRNLRRTFNRETRTEKPLNENTLF